MVTESPSVPSLARVPHLTRHIPDLIDIIYQTTPQKDCKYVIFELWMSIEAHIGILLEKNDHLYLSNQSRGLVVTLLWGQLLEPQPLRQKSTIRVWLCGLFPEIHGTNICYLDKRPNFYDWIHVCSQDIWCDGKTLLPDHKQEQIQKRWTIWFNVYKKGILFDQLQISFQFHCFDYCLIYIFWQPISRWFDLYHMLCCNCAVVRQRDPVAAGGSPSPALSSKRNVTGKLRYKH